MKKFTLFLFLCTCIYSNAQIRFPDKITTSKTANHKLVEGTGIYIILPPGFETFENFIGFGEKKLMASIEVLEFPGRISQAHEEFSKEKLAEQDMKFKSKKSITLNGAPGLYIETIQETDGVILNRNFLIINIGNRIYQLQAIWRKSVEDKEADIIAALTSVYIDPAIKQDLGNKPYSINLSNTKVKFATTVTKRAFLYSSDGKYPPEDKEQTAVIIEVDHGIVNENDREAFAKEKNLKPHSEAFNKYQLKSLKPVTINGLNGFELISFDYYSDSGNKARGFYQVILYGDDQVYIMSGFARKEIDTKMALFKADFKTFKVK